MWNIDVGCIYWEGFPWIAGTRPGNWRGTFEFKYTLRAPFANK